MWLERCGCRRWSISTRRRRWPDRGTFRGSPCRRAPPRPTWAMAAAGPCEVRTPAALAAKNATATIPIVMGAIGDPISTGVVTSLARPGGNITGLSSLAVELEAKRLELLKSLAPQISRVAVLWNADNPSLKVSSRTAIAAAQKLDVKLSFVSTTEEPTLEAVLSRIGRHRPEGLLVMAEPSLIAQGGKITAFATKTRLPAVYAYPEHASLYAGVSVV